MKNKERQKQLDKQKWIVSEQNEYDMSGFMSYCECCTNRGGLHGECQATQEERTTKCYCATAYNRLVRQLSKNT